MGDPTPARIKSTAAITFLLLLNHSPLHAAAILEARIKSPPGPEAAFRTSIAASGDTLIIGAPEENKDSLTWETGAAYIFVRQGSSWTQQAHLTPKTAVRYDHFGTSVAISGDTAIIGAPGDDTLGRGSGTAYIFVREGTNWTQQAQLFDDEIDISASFGRVVSMSSDTALIAGDNGYREPPGTVVFVFIRTENGWQQQGKLRAEFTNGGIFAQSIGLSGDTAVLSNAGGLGSAHIFIRNGTEWHEQAVLGEAGMKEFGSPVAISGDTVLVGAPAPDDGTAGKVFIFARDETYWPLKGELLPPPNTVDRYFGVTLALEGSTAVIGSSTHGLSARNLHIYLRAGTNWAYDSTITPEAGTVFLERVVLSGDRVLIRTQSTAPGEDSYGVNIYQLSTAHALGISTAGESLTLTISASASTRLAVETATSLSGQWTQLTEVQIANNPETLPVALNRNEPARFFRTRQLSP